MVTLYVLATKAGPPITFCISCKILVSTRSTLYLLYLLVLNSKGIKNKGALEMLPESFNLRYVMGLFPLSAN